MKLPAGISGFTDATFGELPKTDGTLFKQLCFTLSFCPSTQLISIAEPGQSSNYHRAEMNRDGHAVLILLNAHFPYLAFTSGGQGKSFDFIDYAYWSEVFSPFYHVLSAVELNVPLDSEQLNALQLNKAEWKQAAYWKPKTTGQLIFNQWD
ncbi:hypothetical protein KQ939_13550 [Planococcus sp. CP5-4]|uniref:hypothetical protein n=1 Tax=unclassified Planococcus (in: firmicutes) TaxID=2662419 RepID=UPI001C24014B|nr:MULTISPECIES: hypothetical protein [unclassified Planococcus (in: firmicutes)]MBU9674450.1 hypothetical protein [Planococcus sp. CP5-4_YE]MBV0910081.1 hypothetical protein [Planococcus sp. CP5-4_UN]MBW6064711.1 hypothetical protein [Planococcus sp. CP5-4]